MVQLSIPESKCQFDDWFVPVFLLVRLGLTLITSYTAYCALAHLYPANPLGRLALMPPSSPASLLREGLREV